MITMTFVREKTRLEKLMAPILAIDRYSDTNFEILNESYRTYAEIIRFLYLKQPNVFGNLCKYELREIKERKRNTKESPSETAMEQSLMAYKNAIVHAIERTLDYIADYIES